MSAAARTGGSAAAGDRPSVSVLVPTRDRPQLLRAALRSFLRQTYDNIVEIIVVFDRCETDDLEDIRAECPARITLRAVSNRRAPGLAGARNTGIIHAEGELVAFCDDDDEWLPDKLSAQVDLWHRYPDAAGVGTGMRIDSAGGGSRVRIAPERVRFEDFLASRIFSIPSSGLLLRRSDLLGAVGLVDEVLPAAYGEDWDMLLRLTRNGDLVNVVDPVVIVNWNRPSFFTEKWHGIADGLTYLLRKHPEFEQSRTGVSRMAAQVAFAKVASGDRGEGARWARASLRRDVTQIRAWASLAVALRLVRAETLVSFANKRGRGL